MLLLYTLRPTDNLRFSELEKGTYATLSDEAGQFECHLNCDNIAAVNMVTKPNKEGDRELYITRFLDTQVHSAAIKQYCAMQSRAAHSTAVTALHAP
jgi:hypothetical protein